LPGMSGTNGHPPDSWHAPPSWLRLPQRAPGELGQNGDAPPAPFDAPPTPTPFANAGPPHGFGTACVHTRASLPRLGCNGGACEEWCVLGGRYARAAVKHVRREVPTHCNQDDLGRVGLGATLPLHRHCVRIHKRSLPLAHEGTRVVGISVGRCVVGISVGRGVAASCHVRPRAPKWVRP
jgi:hypothetical protein